ncbi:hypothetical protein IH781_01745 [Patescibacteria group bacterium]|nr:hypothetical protein [Patescibacteria group bacterium]
MVERLQSEEKTGRGFRVNIYPVMYWGLLFGLGASVLVWLVAQLAQYLSNVLLPVFLGGLVGGAFWSYLRQRNAWSKKRGNKQVAADGASFGAAVRDIAGASANLIDSIDTELAADTKPPVDKQSRPDSERET